MLYKLTKTCNLWRRRTWTNHKMWFFFLGTKVPKKKKKSATYCPRKLCKYIYIYFFYFSQQGL